MAERPDVEHLVKQLMAGASPEEGKALLDALMSGQVSSILERLRRDEAPTLFPIPPGVRGFRVRLDLHGAKPPVWRRLDLPGDLALAGLHDVIQTAMGWLDGHLHRFRAGRDHRSPYFATAFDLEEGDDGLLEVDVRLDQLVAEAGDELWYEYDFGDGWEHRLVVEEVLGEPPTAVRCTAGRMACPPEDCGGMPGYQQLAEWVRGGYDDALLPESFDDAGHARDWLPPDWHPDHFDIDETNAALAVTASPSVPVTGELADLADELDRRASRRLREVLARPLSHESTEVTDAEAARLTETYRILLDVVGDGVSLTGAGYLPPVVVEQFAERSGLTTWWIGKANREDLTPPVAAVHRAARALGLLSVRKGRLSPTAAVVRARQDPQALLRHIAGRLPLGTKEADRDAGWMALAVVGSGTSAPEWHGEIGALLFDLGWRSGYDRASRPPARSATLDVLEHLAGAVRIPVHRLVDVDLSVAATARAAIRMT